MLPFFIFVSLSLGFLLYALAHFWGEAGRPKQRGRPASGTGNQPRRSAQPVEMKMKMRMSVGAERPVLRRRSDGSDADEVFQGIRDGSDRGVLRSVRVGAGSVGTKSERSGAVAKAGGRVA
jgi:hypothetical protein